MTRFQMKYLSPGIKNCQYISCGNAQDTVALDRTDHKILSLLTANPELSRPAAAMKLGIARTTLDNRISKLRKNGVIVGFVNQTDIAKLGMQHAILLVYARGVGRAFRKSLFEFSRNHLYIDSLFQCVGNWEYEIGVEIPNAQAIVEITQELYTTFPREINAIKMLSCFEALKMSLYPFNQHSLLGTELT